MSAFHATVRTAIAGLRPSGNSATRELTLDPESGERIMEALQNLASTNHQSFLEALRDLEVFSIYLRTAEAESPVAADSLQALLGSFPEIQKARSGIASKHQEQAGAEFARFLGTTYPGETAIEPSEPAISVKDLLRKKIK